MSLYTLQQYARKSFPGGFFYELKQISWLSWPVVLTQILQFSFGPMAIIFCGHLGKIQLDCAALATSLLNVTGLTIIVGLSAACDTLFSQTFGSKNKEKLGVILQRSLMILNLASLLCCAIHLNTEKILLLLGQDPEVASLAGEYLAITIPGIWFFSLYVAFSKYLQNQNIIIPNLIIALVSNIINALGHYILIWHFNWGTNGSAFGQVLGYFFMMILTMLYILASGVYKTTCKGFDRESLLHWGDFMKLAWFGMMMTAIEWWSFEIGILLAGTLGITELAAQSVVFQIETVSYMIPFGVGIAASIRVGQHLGSGNAIGAKTTTRVTIIVMGLMGCCAAVIFGVFREQIPVIFTSVEDVIKLSSRILPALAVFSICNFINGVGCGLMKGMGHQKLGALIVVCVYTIAICAGVPVMLKTPSGIEGYWWCLAGSLALETIFLLIFLMNVDWDKETELAFNRTNPHLTSSETEFTNKSNEKKRSEEEYSSLDPIEQEHNGVSNNDGQSLSSGGPDILEGMVPQLNGFDTPQESDAPNKSGDAAKSNTKPNLHQVYPQLNEYGPKHQKTKSKTLKETTGLISSEDRKQATSDSNNTDINYQRIYLKRGLTVLGCVLIFLIGAIVRVTTQTDTMSQNIKEVVKDIISVFNNTINAF